MKEIALRRLAAKQQIDMGGFDRFYFDETGLLHSAAKGKKLAQWVN